MKERKALKLNKQVKIVQKKRCDTLAQIRERVVQRDARIAEALCESRARNEAYAKQQELLVAFERDETNRLIENYERAKTVRSKTLAANAEYVKKKRETEAHMTIHGAVANHKLTYLGAERNAEHRISTLDMVCEGSNDIQKPGTGVRCGVVLTAYGLGSHSMNVICGHHVIKKTKLTSL